MSKRPLYETFPEFIPDNKLYRWNHSVSKGGYYFILGTKDRQPLITEKIKEEINEKLKQFAINMQLVDTTIKIQPDFFIIFMVFRPVTQPQEVINKILEIANSFKIEWDNQYLFNSISDVGTNYINQFIKKYKK